MTEPLPQFEGGRRTRFATQNRRIQVPSPDNTDGSVHPVESQAVSSVGAPAIPVDEARAAITVDDALALVETFPSVGIKARDSIGQRSRRRAAVRILLGWLSGFPGETWQQRWTSSGIEEDPEWMDTIADGFNAANGTTHPSTYAPGAASWLIALDVFRPSYEWLHRQRLSLRILYPVMFCVRDPEGEKVIVDAIERHAESELLNTRYRVHGLYQLARILGHTGKRRASDITIDDLETARESARGQSDYLPSGAAYNAMSWAGFLPAGSPETFLNTRRSRQRTVEELVTRTGIQSEKVRSLFIDYMRVRSVALDYSSLTGLISMVVKNFWVEIEQLSPGIETLHLSPELVDSWKLRVRTIRHGTKAGSPRQNVGALMLAVRAFYYDINDWAVSDPERYGQFAGPNPITAHDTVAFAKQNLRQRAVSHQRTRERQPLLPTLMNWVSERLSWHRKALAAARETEVGAQFVVDGVTCEVVSSLAGIPFGTRHRGVLRMGGLAVRRLDTGELFDAVQRETTFFWRWACFSLLRETGVRIEELEELTHTSIAQYRLPSTGELLPLLQIAPSKTDRERVLLVSPELADVLAAIISRVRGASDTGRIPLIRRWDYHEKLLSEPMPFLFQRPIDGQNRLVNRAWVLKHLRHSVEEAGIVGEDGEPIYFQNHDMRRIFATEAVLAGLPVHILAELLGHDSLETTQQYVAIYPEEVFRAHRAFIERRRALRPSAEYREPTPEEFEEFLGHFERRQLELGTCGRAYGTPCIHEHACVRCPMLQVDSSAIGRLREIADSLQARIHEARDHGWLGEIEGLEVSLAGARQKITGVERRPAGPVSLGLPVFRPADRT